MFRATKTSAFSLVEIIVAVAVFAIFSAAMLTATLGVSFTINNSEDRLAARYLEQEAQEALRSIRDYDWDNLTAGTHGLDESSGYWELSGSSDSFDKFTRSILVTELSSHRKEAEITISWTTDEGQALSTSSTYRLTNWEALFFTLDSQSDFDNGYYNSTLSDSSGSVSLASVGTWAGSVNRVTEDMDGSGDPISTRAYKNQLYIGKEQQSGAEFFIYDISDATEGNLSELYDIEIGYDVNDFVIQDGYAFLATGNNAGELVVVRLSDGTIVNTLDLSSSQNARGIALYGNSVLITTEEDGSTGEFFEVDVSSPEGSLSENSSVEFGLDVVRVSVDGDYAFVATDDSSNELQVVDLTSNTIVDTLNISGSTDMLAMRIDTENDVLYLGREQSGSDEFFAIDISSPTSLGGGSLLGSLDTNNDLRWIDLDDDADYAYLATNDSGQAVAVVDLSSYSIINSIVLSGGDDGTTVEFHGVHLYAGNQDGSNELQLLSSVTEGWAAAFKAETANPGGNQNMYDIVVGDSGDYAYMGRDSTGTCNTSTGQGCEFLIYDISDPQNVSLEGALEIGPDVNDVYVDSDENYAYLATDGTELIVVDISSKSSPSVTGTGYNANSGANGEAVWGYGNYVYLGTRNNNGACNSLTGTDCEFYILDVTVPSLPVLTGAAEIAENVFDIAVNGVYAYLGSDDNNVELFALDLSSPSSPGTPVTTNISGNGNVNGLYYNSDDDTLHVARSASGSSDDYVIYSASGTVLTLLGGIDTNDTNRSVWVLPSEDLAFLAGDQNNEELKIIDISDTSDPQELDSIDLNGDANGISSNGSAIFIASEHNNEELQVITEGNFSTEYAHEAYYQSEVYDSGSSSTSWIAMEWTSSGSGTLEFQIRSASNSGDIEEATWVGDDGTSDSTYSTSGDSITLSGDSTGSRYIQILALFSGDGSSNPTLDEFILGYTQ